MTQLTGV